MSVSESQAASPAEATYSPRGHECVNLFISPWLNDKKKHHPFLIWPFLSLLLPVLYSWLQCVLHAEYFWMHLLHHFSPPNLFVVIMASRCFAFTFLPFTGFSSLPPDLCPFFPLLFITYLLSCQCCCLFLLVAYPPPFSSVSFSGYPLHLIMFPCPPSSPLPPLLLSFFLARSIGWLSSRSLPWSLRLRCTTTSTREPQTTSTFRHGNGSRRHKCSDSPDQCFHLQRGSFTITLRSPASVEPSSLREHIVTKRCYS